MQGKHDPSKRLITFWATEEEKTELQEAATIAGFKTMADYLRWIARTKPQPRQLPKPEEIKK